MSIADHFEQTSDAGMVHGYDASAARRQFHLSAVLFVLIVAVAALLSAIVRFDSEPTHETVAQSTQAPSYVGKL